ncbi:MAG: alpha/beta hydrolase fold domain-containing protein [Rhizobiaceae bacterium]|nr:alpha/beta hydrolase fold domain-containing protein [Rhizobiaceae bacterium]
MTLTIDPELFLETSISDETRRFNQQVIATLQDAPDIWSMPITTVRQNRLKGQGPFPLEAVEETARNLEIATPHGKLELRLFKPRSAVALGSYLHIHGGGWVLGSATAHDERLQQIADNCQLDCVSVEYRLAPEHPYPAGPDDCEQAALWLLNGEHELNTSFLSIGGESAGAHLSALTLIRLRNRIGSCPFHAAVLTAGVFDLGQTPSARNWGTEKLILATRDMQMFATNYVQDAHDYRNPDISPLYSDLNGLPSALFSVGTKDLLLDDTLQMATLWHARNANAQLDVFPGGCHVFQGFPQLKIARDSNTRIDQFLNQMRKAVT